MDNRTVLPSLTLKGWVKDPLEKLDMMLAHMFIAEDGQSYLNNDTVVDLHTLLANTTGRIEPAMVEMRQKIEDYLGSEFDDAHVDIVDVNKEINDPSNAVKLRLNVTVYQDGQPYTIGKLVNSNNSKFRVMTNIHNTGSDR